MNGIMGLQFTILHQFLLLTTVCIRYQTDNCTSWIRVTCTFHSIIRVGTFIVICPMR